MKEDHRNYRRNFCSCKTKPEKKSNRVKALLRWKERLYIGIIAKFEVDLLETNEDIAAQSSEILKQKKTPPPSHTIQTSTNFRNFAELFLCQFKTYHFQTDTNLKALFQVVSMDIP